MGVRNFKTLVWKIKSQIALKQVLNIDALAETLSTHSVSPISSSVRSIDGRLHLSHRLHVLAH